MTMRCLKPGLPGSRRQCPLHLGCDTAAFCASLVEGLAELDSALSSTDDGGESVSMKWCADAMRLVKRMQRELLAIFRRADAPVTVDSCGGGDWFEHYMQETAALLDFCNAFKSAVSRLHRYSMMVDFAAQVGRGAGGVDAAVSLVADTTAPCDGWPESSSSVRGKLSDVKAVASEAERLGRKIMSNSRPVDDAGGDMVVVTLVAKITTAVVSTSVLQALTSPAPINIIGGQCTLGRAAVPEQLRPWRESLSAINARRPASVLEHEKVAMAVRDMVNAKMGGEEHLQVELLRTRSGELRKGVEMFDRVLDQVFDEVIKGRNEMLGIFRNKALTLG